MILPDIALLDAELTYGLPAPITAATGLDAIEAYVSASSDNNPISRMLAVQALTLKGRSLLPAVRSGSNAEA